MNNANITRMSALYAPTLKEDPTDAEIASHKLLLRAGFIRKTAAGIYTFLPLGKRVLTKIENIVREEMDACGAQEIRMPMLQPEELWQESGRADAYGPERMRLNDRHDHEFCLGPAEHVSDPGEVPRRDPPALRSSAQPRVRHEGRLQLP